ncbi:hypothetical protein LC612_41420, partial [Nostoc sp. CHAB 5834]|nr:hypothetical protein [Nostoc sp. CHAB 5834]
DQELTALIHRALRHSQAPTIIDLCSGSGGPMIAVFTRLQKCYPGEGLTLHLTDLYPDRHLVNTINALSASSRIAYVPYPVDAAQVNLVEPGVRTLIGSMHHMKPQVARQILADAQQSRQPLCVYELSDNSFPIYLWWIALPLNFIMALLITPFVKPLTWQQLIFTYAIPIIPFFFAWDGAVSNARTYTLEDLDQLLNDLPSAGYRWEKGRLEGKAKKLYLLGLPINP